MFVFSSLIAQSNSVLFQQGKSKADQYTDERWGESRSTLDQ